MASQSDKAYWSIIQYAYKKMTTLAHTPAGKINVVPYGRRRSAYLLDGSDYDRYLEWFRLHWKAQPLLGMGFFLAISATTIFLRRLLEIPHLYIFIGLAVFCLAGLLFTEFKLRRIKKSFLETFPHAEPTNQKPQVMKNGRLFMFAVNPMIGKIYISFLLLVGMALVLLIVLLPNLLSEAPVLFFGLSGAALLTFAVPFGYFLALYRFKKIHGIPLTSKNLIEREFVPNLEKG